MLATAVALQYGTSPIIVYLVQDLSYYFLLTVKIFDHKADL